MMFWIYIPPIVLIGSIIALVVVLTKKSAEVKKRLKIYGKEKEDHLTAPKKSKLKKVGQGLLHLSEKILVLLKLLAKKSEQSIVRLVSSIRARRMGKSSQYGDLKTENKSAEANSGLNLAGENKTTSENQKAESADDDILVSQNVEWVAGEVTVRKKDKIYEPVMPAKEELAPEDKTREEALIHRIAENPKDIEAYRELGDYYMSVGNIKDAKDSFKMVLRLRPRDLKAKSSLREIEMKMRLGS